MVFNPFPDKPWFLHVCSTDLLKTMQEKENSLPTSNFSFSHSFLYPLRELSAIFLSNLKVSSANSFSLESFVWERVKVYCGSQCTYLCFPGVLLTSTPHNILSKPLAAFPHKHCQNNSQLWERNESCRNDYHQSKERILAKSEIKPVTFCSQVPNATNRAMGLRNNNPFHLSIIILKCLQLII